MKLFTKRLNILLIALMFIGAGRANGQSLQIFPSDTFVYYGTLGTITDNHESIGYFGNNTGSSAVVSWRLISATMDSIWQMSFCDPENCYYFTSGTNATNSHSFSADTGSGNQLRFGVSPSCSADSGTLVILAWLNNDSAATAKTLYFSAYYSGSCASAIQNAVTPQLAIYPNPVSSLLTVEGLNNFKSVKITVYDVLGNIAIEKYVSQPAPSANLNTSNLQNGVYFVTVDSDGARVITKRIQKLD